MMSICNKLKWWGLVIVLVWSYTPLLKAGDFTKEIARSFKVSNDGTLDLTNKHGDVRITTWEQNTIKIEVKVIVQAKDAKQAEGYFDKIKINFENSNNAVKAATTVEETKNGWFSWNTDAWKYEVHYEVKMPKSNQLNLNNRYGNVYIADLNAEANVTLSYGTAKVSQMNGGLNCSLGYGSATISDVKQMSILVKYSNLTLRNSKEVTIQSKYSKIQIDEATEIRSLSKYDTYDIGTVAELKVEGKYDNYKIGQVSTIDAVSQYTDFRIETLLKRGDFDMKYGDVIINDLSTTFDGLKLTGQYTDFLVHTPDNSSFKLDLNSNYTNVKVPKNLESTMKKVENSLYELQGKMGKAGDSLIKIRTKYGSIKIDK